MLKKAVSSAIVLAIIFPAVVTADTGDIQITGENEYKAVRLTPPIYNASDRDLRDLLILDETGTPAPYFINNFETIKKEESDSTYPMVFVDSFVKDGHTYSDYFIEADEQKDMLATSVSVLTDSAMFAKNVEIRGGYDGVTWDFIQNDKLYRVDENEKLSIKFEKPLKYTYYRLKILNNTESVYYNDLLAISGVCLEYSRNTVGQVLFAETMTPEFEAVEQEKSTIIKLHGLKNVKINEIAIETDSQFKRPVHFADDRQKTLYNLSFNDNIYQDTTLDFNGFSTSSDILEVRINNGDDRPINVKNISLTYFTDEIIFKGHNSKSYTLSFGDDTVLNAPVYDIVNYKELIIKEGYDILAVENIKTEEVKEEPQKPDYSTAFNVVVTGVSLLLGFVILTRLRRTGSSDGI